MQVASYLHLLTMYGQILYWWSSASKEVTTEPDTSQFIAEEYLSKKDHNYIPQKCVKFQGTKSKFDQFTNFGYSHLK